MVSNQQKSYRPPRLGKKRAVDAGLKDQRRQGLLAAAEHLLLKGGIEAVSMQEIATLSRVAKGTLYLYFGTKEELLIALLEREYRRWLADLQAWAVNTVQAVDDDLVAWIVDSLKDRPTLLLLLPQSESILEKNAGVASITAHKRALLGDLIAAATAVGRRIGLSAEATVRLILFVHAAIVGLYFKAHPGAAVAEALQNDDLAVFRIDFFPALTTMIAGSFRALRADQARAGS